MKKLLPKHRLKGVIFFALAIFLIFAYMKWQNGYITASDRVMAEFSDSSAIAIFLRGDAQYVRSTEELSSVFALLEEDRSNSITLPDVFSRDVVRKNDSGLTIRFGEAHGCDRALVFEDNRLICSTELYFKLSDAIDKALQK